MMARDPPAARSPMPAKSSPVSRSPIRLYALPFVLFALGLFFQLVVLPSSFTVSHYEVLGVVELASVDEVIGAYEKLSSKWSAGLDIPTASNFIKIRYAYEVLSNPILKRDYDTFGVDEQLHIIELLKQQYEGKPFSQVHIPLLNISFSADSGSMEEAMGTLTEADFFSAVGKNETWLIQVYSAGSIHCAEFSRIWKRILSLLDGVATTGVVELGQVKFASFLSERRSTGQPFFRNGLPSLIAFPPNCRSLRCYRRYNGDLSLDAIVDWMTTSILGLPRILYYSRETLLQNLIAKGGHHKNKIIFFSETGERARPYLRQAARDYWAYAAFGFILWKEEESSVWRNMMSSFRTKSSLFHAGRTACARGGSARSVSLSLGVESAPAVVVLKEPGVKPIVYHGSFNRSWFLHMMEENKHQDLPQLRSITSRDLGCDARGHSRAGYDTLTWYCVVVAGRPSFQLKSFRETLRSVKDAVMNDSEKDAALYDALKGSRLTFAWLDGEFQSKYCFFYLHSENSYETCGPRRYGDPVDVPRLFIVRYKRNSTESILTPQKKVKSIWDEFQEEDVNLASQLVARYNGPDDIHEVINWISQIIDDGDKKNLPYFRARTPELIPEDKNAPQPSAWQRISRDGSLRKKLEDVLRDVYGRLADPRLGPLFMLGACISFSTIWLKNSWKKPNGEKGYHAAATQEDPPDARQALSSDSDSE